MLSKYSFSTALLALVATTFANTGVVNPSNELICANKNSDVVSAIDLFCVNRGIMIPSGAAAKGRSSNNGKAHVKIFGLCSPPQYVPATICFEQFYSLCAKGAANGAAFGQYGWHNKCQNWQITVS